MAIVDENVAVILRYTFQGQRCENVQWYGPSGAAFLTANAVNVAQAWWNDVKTVWRALVPNSSAFTFDSVLVKEFSPTGAFGTYAVPVAEVFGTRPPGTLGDFLPPFNAAGVQLVVSSRLTRPGQKRFPGILEGDSDTLGIGAAFQALVAAVAAKYSSAITLGVPVATGVLTPRVLRVDRASGALLANQDVTGFLLNTFPTSQVSRKRGHGF